MVAELIVSSQRGEGITKRVAQQVRGERFNASVSKSGFDWSSFPGTIIFCITICG